MTSPPGSSPYAIRATPHQVLSAVAAPEIAPPAGSAVRIRRALERAEQAFVAQAAAEGGIGPWRRRIEGRFQAAREALVVSSVSRAESAALLVALLDHAVRDHCWVQVEADPDRSWLVLWRHLARRALPPYRTEPLFLLGWTAWRRGDEVGSRAAVDEALAQDPGHRASTLLDWMLSVGTDPRLLPSLAGCRPAAAPDRNAT